ncbi:hypothetical protein ACLOJK_028127 [Asimina triloba]
MALAASSKTDAVWIYTLSYGGGIVSGDCISCSVAVGEACTAVLTTQASTKARVGSHALLAILPDPVTCFSTARYTQKQIFRVASDSSLVIVDWLTSGRHECGEKWDFDLYKSTNNIFLEGNEPLFLDSGVPNAGVPLGGDTFFRFTFHAGIFALHSVYAKGTSYEIHLQHTSKEVYSVKQVLLEKGSSISVADRMQEYQVVVMVVIMGPRLKNIQNQVQEAVKKMMSKQIYAPTSGRSMKTGSDRGLYKPALIASCSAFGPKASQSSLQQFVGMGLVVRISAVTTESPAWSHFLGHLHISEYEFLFDFLLSNVLDYVLLLLHHLLPLFLLKVRHFDCPYFLLMFWNLEVLVPISVAVFVVASTTIILETDANVIAGKVATHGLDGAATLSEQWVKQRGLFSFACNICQHDKGDDEPRVVHEKNGFCFRFKD